MLHNQKSQRQSSQPAQVLLSHLLLRNLSLRKKNKGRGFREEWKLGRPWLKYDSSKGLMFCEICCGQNIQTKRGKLKESAFVKGCSNFKREAVEDHEKATTHTRAVEAHTNQQKPFEEKPAGQAWNALSKAKHISMMSWWHRILI